MTDNPTFVQALANATQRPVEISRVREATALGAALLAGVAVGHHDSIDAEIVVPEPAPRYAPVAEAAAVEVDVVEVEVVEAEPVGIRHPASDPLAPIMALSADEKIALFS
jgi:glycerol kinase